MPGETMAFSLKAEGRVEESKLRHKWTVSEGYIIEGQNTSMIKVATTPDLGGSVITAKVTIEGLPKNCANEASETSSIGVIPGCGFGVDDYRKIPLQEEYGRLDNLFSRLLYDLEYKGFILISIDEIETVDQAKKHIKKLMRHVKFRKFAKERLVFAIEKKSDYHLT
ncbi:MAG: hypothetical protein LH614_01270, partial [Pyrinomonadaceae bacterium]|nr:hypothetical protein [Pyrinomonadaceae bacterium]